jgi:hypothetical protein
MDMRWRDREDLPPRMDTLSAYVDRLLDAQAIRLELDIMALRDTGVHLDDLEIVCGRFTRSSVRQITRGI